MLFQSAPRVLLRGDVGIVTSLGMVPCFNPRPAFFCGATVEPRGSRSTHAVSIRAPRSSAGRRGRLDRRAGARKVSIRAPRSSAGRRSRSHRRALRTCFNPRPAFFCGATQQYSPKYQRNVFQSAPRVLLRGDAYNPGSGRPHWCFNPRPAFFCGATWRIRQSSSTFYVSIRAPRSSAGRPDLANWQAFLAWFQSAPRVLLRGDARLAWWRATTCKFQSAPRVLLRGDSA